MTMFVLECSLGHSDFEGYWINGTDSGGRAEVLVRIFYNGSDPIKYCKFSCSPVNRVGDYVACSITGKVKTEISITGPIVASPYFQTYRIEDVWWNTDIVKVRYGDAIVQFMDGSTETVSWEKMKKYLPLAEKEEADAKFKDRIKSCLFTFIAILCIALPILIFRSCEFLK